MTYWTDADSWSHAVAVAARGSFAVLLLSGCVSCGDNEPAPFSLTPASGPADPSATTGGQEDASEFGGRDCEPGDSRACYAGPLELRGVGACTEGQQVCTALGAWGACRGWTAPVGEVPCNDIDDDCDGATDDADGDVVQPLAGLQAGVCEGARRRCAGPGLWGPADYAAIPGYEPVEARCDGLDNDCDGRVDGDDPDLRAPALPGFEATEAQCDGLDNDCDGLTDLEDADVLAPAARLSVGMCAGLVKRCAGEQGWVEPDYLAVPGYERLESRCDGLDNDCDGSVDEPASLEAAPLADVQEGVCAGVRKVCELRWREPDALELGVWAEAYQADETGCDGLDNDCDGTVDEATDLRSDPDNCGSCDRQCAVPHGEPRCLGGLCRIGECDPGFHDINRRRPDGCEYACEPADPPIERCNGLDDDCDGLVDQGLDPPSCFIDGRCVAEGAVRDDNPCEICRAELEPAAWTTLEGETCDDGDDGTPVDLCILGRCRGGGVLTDSDRRQCWGAQGQEIRCPLAGEPGFGQDAQYVGAQPRFSVEDGVVIDENTGLIWQASPSAPPSTLAVAKAHCRVLVHAGFDDWRLPNARELHSVVQTGFPSEYGGRSSGSGRRTASRSRRPRRRRGSPTTTSWRR